MGLMNPTVMVWIGDVVPFSFRGRFSSYLGTSVFIGQFISPILFGRILVQAGLKGVFLACTGISMIWLFLILFLLEKLTLREKPVLEQIPVKNASAPEKSQ
jgi:MFS family permease